MAFQDPVISVISHDYDDYNSLFSWISLHLLENKAETRKTGLYSRRYGICGRHERFYANFSHTSSHIEVKDRMTYSALKYYVGSYSKNFDSFCFYIFPVILCIYLVRLLGHTHQLILHTDNDIFRVHLQKFRAFWHKFKLILRIFRLILRLFRFIILISRVTFRIFRMRVK